MTRTVHLVEEVEEELRSAYVWYESKRPRLGEEFLMCSGALFETLTRHPDRYRQVYEGARMALARMLPYAGIYLVGEDRVLVTAILHGNRDPATWRSRLR